MGFEINKKYLAPKAHYLLYFGGVAAFWPYINVFGKQLGISEVNVGLIFTAAPVTGLISMPLFGFIADRYKIKKKLFLVFNIVNLIAILCFAILTSTEANTNRPVKVQCGTGVSFISHCHQDMGPGSRWNSTSIREKILAEVDTKDYPIVCQVDCKTNRAEVNKFCTSLFVGNRSPPKICENSTLQDPSHASFKVLLASRKVVPLENCLDIYIDKIGIIDEDFETRARGLSCEPQANFDQCQINCPDLPSANMAMVDNENHENGDDIYKKAFWLYVFLAILGWIAMSVVTSVADALCFQTLGDRSDLYGQQRKWGSIGWGLFTLISGYLIDLVSGDSIIKNYTPCYWMAGILLTLNFIVCWRWEVIEEERPKALGRRMITLVTEPKISVFILACVTVGICTGLQWNFLFWYVEDLSKEQLDYSMESGRWIKLLQGLISVVQCFCGELPFFYWAGKFIKYFGHVNSMVIVIFTFGVRFLLYSILTNPWWVLPVELLQGLTYGIFYANMATYAYAVSPEGTAATVQGIVGSAFEGIGVGVGSLVGGALFHEIHGRSVFRTFGTFAIFMSILYKGLMMSIDRKFQPIPQHSGNDLIHATEMKVVTKQPNEVS